MLDPRRIRDEFEAVKKGLSNRGQSLDVLDHFVETDKAWRKALQEVETLSAERNALTPKGKPTPEQLQQLKQLSEQLKGKQESLSPLESDIEKAALIIPNIPHPSVPVGKDESENVVVKTVGTPKTFNFTPKPHEELAVNLGLLDFERAAKISGARFAVYKGLGARLERSLIQLMLDKHSLNHGYTEILPPVLVNSASMQGTGQLPKFADDSFKIDDTDLWLSPTSEVQLTNLYRDTIIPEEELPVKMTAYTACFRKEAGSYGKDMSGIIRQHQFNKVELVKIVHPDQSLNELELLLADAESILQALELPYRVVSLCTGDIGFSSAKTYDIEVWFPSQNKYREISSCSTFLDFQARRAMIRYKSKESGKVQYAHTLNGSGLAVGRTFAALLENYQQEDGSITIPKPLQPFLGVSSLAP
jgi:seryl-tRNA synthetase